MDGAWNRLETVPPAGGTGGTLTVVAGSTFLLSDPAGDIAHDRPQGFFVADTRLLSRWQLRVDGRPTEPLRPQQREPFTATVLARVPPAPGLADSHLLVVRRRTLGTGLREHLTVRNTSPSALACGVELLIGADFADLFEVKDQHLGHSAPVSVGSTATGLRITGSRAGREMTVEIVSAGAVPLTVSPDAMRWRPVIEGHGEWAVTLDVGLHPRTGPVVEDEVSATSIPARRLQQWRNAAPTVTTGNADLAATLSRSVEDLGALRIFDPRHPRRAVVAAGVPWFMALFGRDSLLTSWMLLPWDTELTLGTLRTLADRQGKRLVEETEEAPGRILHELRFGPATGAAFGDDGVYYGTADATALFVMLVAELARWTGMTEEIRGLLPHVDRALDWIVGPGDSDGDGFVEYRRSSSHGLVNQGWRDSWDGVPRRDGSPADPPIALCEVQAYSYAAFRGRAELAEASGDDAAAAHWHRAAEELQARFDEAFWLPDRGWYALALDGDKAPVDVLTSNLGHCLWAGIVPEERAGPLADVLLGPSMFSGWGVRTVAADEASYNPMSYHNGSVWPHDNALCAAGLMRYGFVEQAQRVITAQFEAARWFGHRLPELFCGFGRSDFDEPVEYPSACSPQAWAASAPLLHLRTMLRLEPDRAHDGIECAPAVPPEFLPFRLSGIPVGDRTWSVDGDGGTRSCEPGEESGEESGEELSEGRYG